MQLRSQKVTTLAVLSVILFLAFPESGFGGHCPYPTTKFIYCNTQSCHGSIDIQTCQQPNTNNQECILAQTVYCCTAQYKTYMNGASCNLLPIATAAPAAGQRVVKYFMPLSDGSVVSTFVTARPCANEKGKSNAIGASN
jgi:hypothetical protein